MCLPPSPSGKIGEVCACVGDGLVDLGGGGAAGGGFLGEGA